MFREESVDRVLVDCQMPEMDGFDATIVMSTSDPLSAGIIESVQDSALAHRHARVDPDATSASSRSFMKSRASRSLLWRTRTSRS